MAYKKIPCKNCGKLIQSIYSRTEYNHSGLCKECYKIQKDSEKIEHWKNTGETGCKVATTLRNCIRDYIFQKQKKKCAICNLDAQWNGKELHFILDHIDGDASNNWEDNLRLICPNCDSQLDTYKSRNKNSARAHRKDYYIVADELAEAPAPT